MGAKSEKETRDRKIFAGAFMTCWAVHKTGEPSELIISAYHKALEKYSIYEIERAFGFALTNLKFFPKPVELIDHIKSISQPEINIEATAEQQWRIVLSSLGKGPFTDPITTYLCEHQFRHSYLRNLLEKNEQWEQKRFCKAYELAAQIPIEHLQIDNNQLQRRIPNGI